MRFQFTKPDCGYVAIAPDGSSRAACALRLPWQVSLDACMLRNGLHGEDAHLLTGLWTVREGELRGRTLVDHDIEIRVTVMTDTSQHSLQSCRIELSMVNRGAGHRAAPALMVGLDLPPPPRQLRLGPDFADVTDSEGRLWSLCWSSPAVRLPEDRQHAKDDTRHASAAMRPTFLRAARDLVAMTLPLGAALESGMIATIAGELTVTPPARTAEISDRPSR